MDKGQRDEHRLEESMVTDFEKDMSYGDYLHLNQIFIKSASTFRPSR